MKGEKKSLETIWLFAYLDRLEHIPPDCSYEKNGGIQYAKWAGSGQWRHRVCDGELHQPRNRAAFLFQIRIAGGIFPDLTEHGISFILRDRNPSQRYLKFEFSCPSEVSGVRLKVQCPMSKVRCQMTTEKTKEKSLVNGEKI